jgi:hypothetical protein
VSHRTKQDNWKISTNTIGLGGGTTSRLAQTNTFALNTATGTKADIEIGSKFLTRLNFTQFEPQTIFQTVLFPQRCTEEAPVVTTIDNNPNFLSTTIKFLNGYDTTISNQFFDNSNNENLVIDTVSHFHYSRLNGLEIDSIQNPPVLCGVN